MHFPLEASEALSAASMHQELDFRQIDWFDVPPQVLQLREPTTQMPQMFAPRIRPALTAGMKAKSAEVRGMIWLLYCALFATWLDEELTALKITENYRRVFIDAILRRITPQEAEQLWRKGKLLLNHFVMTSHKLISHPRLTTTVVKSRIFRQ